MNGTATMGRDANLAPILDKWPKPGQFTAPYAFVIKSERKSPLPWCRVWQTERMPVPAFNSFATAEEAQNPRAKSEQAA